MNELGLFSILPLSFFAAFSLLIMTFFITILYGHKYRLFLLTSQTILLILFLTLTPGLIEGTARFTAAYVNFKASDYITQTGHINPSATWILNWPSFSILVSIFAQITTIPGQFILLAYPTIFNLALFIPLFLLFRIILKDSKMIWLAIWFVFIGNWIGQDYFSMQSLAFLVIIIMLFLLFRNMNGKMKTRGWAILLLLLFFFVVSSHLLSSMLFASILIVFFITKQLPRFNLTVIAIVLIAAWSIFGAYTYLSNDLLLNFSQSLNLSTIFQRNLQSRLISGSTLHIEVTEIRVIFSAVMVGFGGLGILAVSLRRKIDQVTKQVLFLLLSIGLLLFSFAYGGELFMRLYMFSLIPLAYFSAKLFVNHKRIFFVAILFFVIVVPPFVMLSRYGNESMDYVPLSEQVGVNFLYSHSTIGYVIGGTTGGDFRDFTYRQGYHLVSLYYEIDELNESNLLWSSKHFSTNEPTFLCISYETNQFFSNYVGDDQFVTNLQINATQSVNYNLVYSNPSLSVYVNQP